METGTSEECLSSVDFASRLNGSCSDVAGLDTVCSAGSTFDSQTSGCVSESSSSLARLDRLSNAGGDSCESSSRTSTRHSAADLKSKPSVDVPQLQPTSTTVSDSSNTSRSVQFSVFCCSGDDDDDEVHLVH